MGSSYLPNPASIAGRGSILRFSPEPYAGGEVGVCPVCKIYSEVNSPDFLTSYDSSKLFLCHKTLLSGDVEQRSILVCAECRRKLNEFRDIISRKKLKIFPLFVRPDEVDIEINLIKDNLTDDKNPFSFIFDQLKSRKNKNIFDFYLFVMSGDYFFFDYVSAYKWEIGVYIECFDNANKKYTVTRNEIERKILSALTGHSLVDYFGKINGSDNQQTSIIYSIRQKLFDFVYRNQNSLTAHDLRDIILFRIEKEIRNKSGADCRPFLNLFFNKHLLEGNAMNEKNMLLNKVKQSREAVISGKHDEFQISDDEQWAYYTGQLAYYLVSQSESHDKTYGLLEPFINKSTTKHVKIVIEQLIERYKHAINLNNQRFRIIATNVLSYVIDRPFIDLKIPFYTGAFDDNVIYFKKEKITGGN